MYSLHRVIHFLRRFRFTNESVGVTVFTQALHVLLLTEMAADDLN